MVNELIECGANVNQVNEKGFAPLHFTAASRHGALCLELLVCNGADVNIKVSWYLDKYSLCVEDCFVLVMWLELEIFPPGQSSRAYYRLR